MTIITIIDTLQVFYANANVKQVDVPSFSGSFGILPKHVPTLAILKPGIVTVFENDGASKKIFVSSGTVRIGFVLLKSDELLFSNTNFD